VCTQAKQKKGVTNNKEQIKRTYFANYDFSGLFDIIFNGVSIGRKYEGWSG